jgi:protein disulfide-isomerase A1
MKYLTLLCLAICLHAAFTVENWGLKEEDDVVVLETSTFDKALEDHDHILVEFYAPWCGHCKKLAPEYSQAAAILKKADPPVPLAKVDATIEKDLATKFGIQGFPTLKWFVKGQESEYKGGRTKQEIIDWVTKKTGPPSKLVETAEALAEMKKDAKVLVMFFGTADSAAFQNYQSSASTIDGVSFGHSFNADLVAEHGSRVVMFKQFDEGRNDLDGEWTSDSFKSWLEEHRYELVMPFEGEEPIARIFQQENAALILFSDKDGEHNTVFQEFAKANKGKIIFSVSRTNEGLGQRLAEYIGVTSENAPTIRLIHPTGGDLSKYEFPGQINQADLTEYLNKFKAGTLDRSYKSAAAPASNDEPVKVVVGTTFDDFVVNSGKDVLLEFYAPWCGHCKSLAPKYDEAAKKLLHLSDKLTLAKIDATENEIPGVAIQGFPTLKYWKAGNPNPVDYDGPRETDGIVDWIKKNSSFEWVEAPAGETDL